MVQIIIKDLILLSKQQVQIQLIHSYSGIIFILSRRCWLFVVTRYSFPRGRYCYQQRKLRWDLWNVESSCIEMLGWCSEDNCGNDMIGWYNEDSSGNDMLDWFNEDSISEILGWFSEGISGDMLGWFREGCGCRILCW